jgi:hypothetical protein
VFRETILVTCEPVRSEGAFWDWTAAAKSAPPRLGNRFDHAK